MKSYSVELQINLSRYLDVVFFLRNSFSDRRRG
jgi:hypothetical protein